MNAPRLFLLLAFGLAACQTPASPPVVLVGIDGLRPDAIQQVATPNLDFLMESGASNLNARAVLPTSGSPNWMSMISGAGPEQHGVTSDAWEPDRYVLPPTRRTARGTFPTIFDVIAENRPQTRMAAVYEWRGLGRMVPTTLLSEDIPADSAPEVATRAASILSTSEADFLLVQFSLVADAGREFGFESAAYLRAVEDADALVGELLTALRDAGTLDATTILVTSSHGGSGRAFGGESMQEIEIPWIIRGPGISAGTQLETPVNTFDTAATLAYALDVPQPHVWRGRSVAEAFSSPAEDRLAPGIEGVKQVVIIGVDGMSPDGMRNARTPTLDRFMKEGAYSMHARSVLTSSSSQNWASMVMGAGPEQHGITSNGWERDDFSIQPTTSSAENIFPSVYSVIRDAEPDARIVSVYDWGGYGRLIPRSVLDVDVDGDGPEDTIAAAVESLKGGAPRLLFVHLDHVDGAGHGFGHGSPEYYASVERADDNLGVLLGAYEEAGLMGSTLFIVTSDHGGRGTGHGGETLGEMEIPWLVLGPGVVAGKPLVAAIDQYDTAATALFALGIDQPLHWVARPVLSAFEGFPDPEDGVTVAMAAPRLDPAEGYFTGTVPDIRVIGSSTDADLRYTTDGTVPDADSPRVEGVLRFEASTLLTVAEWKDGVAGAPSFGLFRIVPPDAPKLVSYRYFEGSWGGFLPDFDALVPVSTGMAHEMMVQELQGRRDDAFGAVFETGFQADVAGTYAFFLTSDDGSRLYVNDALVVDNDGDHGAITAGGSVELTPGLHHLRVDYFENGGGEVLDVAFRRPGGRTQLLTYEDVEERP